MRDGSESPDPAHHQDTSPETSPAEPEDEPEETSARVPLDAILASVALHATEFRALAMPKKTAPAATEPAPETDAEKPPRASFATLREAFHEAAEGMTPAHFRAIRVAAYMQAQKAEESAAQRRQRAWFALVLGLGLLALAVLAMRAHARRTAARTAAAPPVAPAPVVRPPFNPTLHGSLEDFRTTYGHLPPPDPATRRHAPSTLGLDRHGARIAGLYASGSDEQDEREALERAERGW